MKYPYKLYCISFFSLIILTVTAQDKKINNTTQLWSEADLLGRISKKLKWQCDFQYSRQSPYEKISFLKYGEQLTIRPWIHYYPVPSIKLSAFAGLWYNYPISDMGQRDYPEYRIAFQGQFYKLLGTNTISNRFRTEIREIKDRGNIFETVFRGRYMLKYQKLLCHKIYDKKSAYTILSNELFINGESKVTGYKLFDQNRFFIGLGYNISDNLAVETGYYNQYAYHSHDSNFDSNHIWQVSIIIDNLTNQ